MLNISTDNLNWIAGFLEGEACFGKTCNTKKTGSIYIQVSQVELYPLEKLQKLLGGNIHKYSHGTKNPKHRDFYRWQVCGMTAEELMKMLFSLLSPKRQNKITDLLYWYSTLPGVNYIKSGRKFCRQGTHVWSGHNIGIDHKGNNFCKACKLAWQTRKRASTVIKEAEQLIQTV